MFESRRFAEKSLNKEIHRVIGEVHLHQYGNFLEKYNGRIQSFKSKLSNSHKVCTTIVGLENDIFEDVELLQLVQSENKLLSRILASLGGICEELNLLCNEAMRDYYIDFAYFGEGIIKSDNGVPSINNLMSKLQKASFFIERSQQVIVLLLRQICAIVGKKMCAGPSGSTFPELLDHLADLLVCLIILDTVCADVLKEHWTVYRKKVRSMQHNPSKFDVSLDDLRLLDKCLFEIENKVLNGNIIQHTLERCVDEGLVIIMKNSSLGSEFTTYISQMLGELEKDDENISFTQLWLQVNAMCVLSYTCFGHLDKKLYKRLLEISTCTIIGNILWHPEKFLMKHIPTLATTLDIKAAANNRLLLIVARTQNIPKVSHILCTEAYSWITEITSAVNIDLSEIKLRQLQNSSNVLVEGVKIVKKISETVKWITNVHAGEGRPMTKSVVLALCRLTEVLKAIQCTIYKNFTQLAYIITLISQQLTHKALTILAHIKKGFIQEKSYKEQQIDILSALIIAERALAGPTTRRRILVARLAISASGLSPDELIELRSVINRLEIICSVHSLIHKLCNCSFLYWHQVLLPVYFSKLVDTRVDLSRFYLLVNSINDCIDIMGPKVEKSMEGYIKKEMMLPLNQLVETNLRLQTHLHLELLPPDPFQKPPINSFVHLTPVLFNDKYLHIKEEVEHYLSSMFYNLTTVVLHDWRIYGEMRRLAVLQYGLNTVDDNLPSQTLEQGIDVLEIMRNIHIFVGKYVYNLNNQVFIEDKSNNKHLNTINISHVANSIRTHGIGIMNTTVNFTYQFLQNQFYIFSQFMYDEQIKSRLLKDLRFFGEHRNELHQMYPYERAEKFNFAIKKLGINTEGLSFLDLFRKLITHIGNAMGYIRMIRSGGRRCLADATCFLPDLKTVDQLNILREHENLPSQTKKSIECFAHDVNNLVENFEEATEYFKLLINVFTPAFRNIENVHLRNFYIIIPPLTINFIEHIFVCKEKISKKNRDCATFTDDGFAIGLAYIVELLNQNTQLNSLQWFQSVKAKYIKDWKNLEDQKVTASKEDNKLRQTLALTEKRLNTFDQEFQLLYYNFNSARIFFQS